MMALCGASERTEAMWRDLIQKAGLEVHTVYVAKDEESESVIEVVKG